MDNMDQILDAPEAEKIRLEYAGFWIRVGAYILDSLILLVVTVILGMVLSSAGSQVLVSLVNLLIGVSYFAIMESSEHQATLGKMAVGIRVGDENGDRISGLNAIGRYFAKIISALLLLIGFMMVGWDEKCQGLHDKLANTYVFYR